MSNHTDAVENVRGWQLAYIIRFS